MAATGECVRCCRDTARSGDAIEFAVSFVDDVLKHIELLLFMTEPGATLILDAFPRCILGHINNIIINKMVKVMIVPMQTK